MMVARIWYCCQDTNGSKWYLVGVVVGRTVRGTRVTVYGVLETLAAGWNPREVVEEFDIYGRSGI